MQRILFTFVSLTNNLLDLKILNYMYIEFAIKLSNAKSSRSNF